MDYISPEDVKETLDRAKRNGAAGVLRIIYIPHDLSKEFSQAYYPVDDAQDFQNNAINTFLAMLDVRNSSFDKENRLTLNDFSVKKTQASNGLGVITYTRK